MFSFVQFINFYFIWCISKLCQYLDYFRFNFFLHHGLRPTNKIYNSFQFDLTIWCKNPCWFGSALSFPVSFSSENRNLNWGPRNLHKECAHPNRWGDKHTHTHSHFIPSKKDFWYIKVHRYNIFNFILFNFVIYFVNKYMFQNFVYIVLCIIPGLFFSAPWS